MLSIISSVICSRYVISYNLFLTLYVIHYFSCYMFTLFLLLYVFRYVIRYTLFVISYVICYTLYLICSKEKTMQWYNVWWKKLLSSFFIEKTLGPVVFHSKKSPTRSFSSYKKVFAPFFYVSKKSLCPVVYRMKKSARPVVYGVKKSTRPVYFLPGPVPDKFWSVPYGQKDYLYQNLTSLIPKFELFFWNFSEIWFQIRIQQPFLLLAANFQKNLCFFDSDNQNLVILLLYGKHRQIMHAGRKYSRSDVIKKIEML